MFFFASPILACFGGGTLVEPVVGAGGGGGGFQAFAVGVEYTTTKTNLLSRNAPKALALVPAATEISLVYTPVQHHDSPSVAGPRTLRP